MLNGVTTYYVGNHFEWTGSTSTMVKYYYAGGQRVAMRQGNPGTVYYLFGDHLGSTAKTYNASTGATTELRYHPWGGTRFTSGTTPTTRRYTGQIEDAAIGLYPSATSGQAFYNARYYDSALGRFIQADTIVPSPANPQSLNRYSYVLNSPLRYTDPTGHFTEDQIRQYYLNWGWMTEAEINTLIENWKSDQGQWWSLLLEAEYGDILDADSTTTYLGMKTLTGRVIGKFTTGDNGTFDFTLAKFDSLRWELNGDELLNIDGGINYANGLTLFASCFFCGDRGELPQDILLARQGTDGQYHARAGTGIYYDPAGGINTPNPNPDDAFWGWARVFGGALGLASSAKSIRAGSDRAGEVARGGVSASWGVHGGFNMVVSYSHGKNAQERLIPYR